MSLATSSFFFICECARFLLFIIIPVASNLWLGYSLRKAILCAAIVSDQLACIAHCYWWRPPRKNFIKINALLSEIASENSLIYH